MVSISNADYKELCKFVNHVYEKTRKGEKVSKLWAEVSARRLWKMMDKVIKTQAKTLEDNENEA